MMTCKICSSSARAAIDKALVDGRSLRDVAGQYGVSRSAIDRHKRHIPKALSKAKQAETAAESTSLLSRVEKLMARCEGLSQKAEAAGKWSGAAAAAREVRGCLELLAKISGELQPRSGGVAINLGVGGVEDVRAKLAARLRGFGGEQAAAVSIDIRALRALPIEQLQILHERFLEAFPDEYLDREIAGITGVKTLAEALLFDEETVPGPSNYEACKRNWEAMRANDIAAGKPPRGWNPYRSASADDRRRMLLAAWFRITGEDLGATLSGAATSATIQIEFNLEEGRDQWSESWPKAQLLLVSTEGPADVKLLAAGSSGA